MYLANVSPPWDSRYEVSGIGHQFLKAFATDLAVCGGLGLDAEGAVALRGGAGDVPFGLGGPSVAHDHSLPAPVMDVVASIPL